MRSYPLRRSIHQSPPAGARAAVGEPTAQRGPAGRPCRRRRRGTQLRFFAVAGEYQPNVDSLLDSDDETEIEPTADPFLDVPWWKLGGATSAGKGETAPPAFAGMSSGAGD